MSRRKYVEFFEPSDGTTTFTQPDDIIENYGVKREYGIGVTPEESERRAQINVEQTLDEWLNELEYRE